MDLYGSTKSDRNSALRLCVYNLYQTGRSRRTLYNRCMNPTPLTDVHQGMSNNLLRKACSYSSYTNLYGFPKLDPNSAVRLFVYNLYQTGRSRRTFYNRCTTQRPPMDFHQAMANNVQRKAFSYSSCTGFFGFPNSDPNSSIRLCVCTKYTKLGGLVVSCTPGVRLPDRSRMFTRRWSTMCSEWHFCTPPVRISTALQNRTETVHLGYVYTICTKLGSPVENCTTGVRLQDRSWMFTRSCQTICIERHFRTAPVRICMVPEVGSE